MNDHWVLPVLKFSIVNYIKAIFLCAAALLLLSTCDKTPPDPLCPGHNDTTTLPPPTQCGANTFGCLVNGEVWVPEVKPNNPYIEKVFSDYRKNYFVIDGTKWLDQDGTHEVIRIKVYEDIGTTGIYSIPPNVNSKSSGNVTYFQSDEEFETMTMNSGQLKVTKLDRENYIISGTFWFTAVNNRGDTIRVTDGRFDVRE